MQAFSSQRLPLASPHTQTAPGSGLICLRTGGLGTQASLDLVDAPEKPA
jgi:hypothetical protein